MSHNGPIVIVDDDPDDLDLITTALHQINPAIEIRTFINGQEAFYYLCTTNEKPFVILCDIKMPVMNGLELRKSINEDEFLRRKSIPFIFVTSLVSQFIVNEAYELTVQGFFEKGKTYEELKDYLQAIVLYWKDCVHPNRF